jgi:TRIAD3 protein (E3 ubiquitin-protein ligase RNF216)
MMDLAADDVETGAIARHLYELFPNIDPQFVQRVIHDGQKNLDACTTLIMERMEKDGGYPKAVPSKKRPREEQRVECVTHMGNMVPKQFVLDRSKCTNEAAYWTEWYAHPNQLMLCSKNVLKLVFPQVPLPYVQSIMTSVMSQLLPAWYILSNHVKEQKEGTKRHFKQLKRQRAVGDNVLTIIRHPKLREEYAFLDNYMVTEVVRTDGLMAKRLNESEYEETGNLLECGCCFGDHPFENMVTCDDGHLFCRTCAQRAAEELIGQGRSEFKCLNTSENCPYAFTEQQLRKFLPPSLYRLYEKLLQSNILRQAGLPGLTECPFCDYAALVENEHDREFHCGSCDVVSCRLCKKETHIPLTCEGSRGHGG